MQETTLHCEPHFWLLDQPPYHSNVWLFKTNFLRGVGEFISRQPYPSGITLRIITSGKWQMKMCGGVYELAPGDIFLALPGIYIEFGHYSPVGNWEWYELQFNGGAAEEFIREFGVDKHHPVTQPRHPATAIRIFKKLHQMLGSPDRDVTTISSWFFRLTQHCGTLPPEKVAGPADTAEELVTRAITLLETDPSNHWNVNEIAQLLNVNRTTLGRAFKKCGHGTPHEFMNTYRLIKVMDLLRNTSLTIAAIATASGFSNEKYFISWFRHQTGITPGKWRNQPDAVSHKAESDSQN